MVKWKQIKSKDELKGIKTGIYRWVAYDKKQQITEMYIGESSNLPLRYYDYTRPYEDRHKKQYPTDFRIAQNIIEARNHGLDVVFEIIQFDKILNIKMSDLDDKNARVAIEQLQIFLVKQENKIKLWNK